MAIKTLKLRYLDNRQELCLYRERRIEERNGELKLVLTPITGKIENVFAVEELASWMDLDA